MCHVQVPTVASTQGLAMLDLSSNISHISGRRTLRGRSLVAALGRLRVRARDLDAILVVRRILPLGLDPIDCISRLTPDASFWIWQQGKDNTTFVAIGACLQIVSTGESDLMHVTAALLDRVVDLESDGGGMHETLLPRIPVAFVGQAFDPDHQRRAADWKNWPAHEVLMPQTLLCSIPGKEGNEPLRCLVQYEELGPESDVDALAKRMEDDCARWSNQGDVRETAAVPACHLKWNSDESYEAWCSRVDDARASIARGDMTKVVLARAARTVLASPNAVDIRLTFHCLRASHPASICFAINRPSMGCFMGATPELLLEVEGRDVRTQALAGTSRRGQDPNEDKLLAAQLLSSKKDLREHRMVVDALRAALRDHCTEFSCAPEPRLVHLPHVQHLETELTGKLRHIGAILNVLRDVHPTPSVSGAPREAAMQWLRVHESLDRGWYAAPIGWITASGDGFFAVALRSMLVRSHEVIAFAGAGVVADSNPASEWRETELKLHTAMESLCLQP